MNAVIRRPALFIIITRTIFSAVGCLAATCGVFFFRFSSMYEHRTFATIPSITQAIAECHFVDERFHLLPSNFFFFVVVCVVLVQSAVRCGGETAATNGALCANSHNIHKFNKLAAHTFPSLPLHRHYCERQIIIIISFSSFIFIRGLICIHWNNCCSRSQSRQFATRSEHRNRTQVLDRSLM